MSPDDDLYVGPTVLAPGVKEPNQLADHLARWIVVPLMLGLVAIILVFYVFFSSAVVDGDSMAPTLSSGDYLLITHGAAGLKRGDIIVAKVVEREGTVELVKRVIALPGDTVEIKHDVAYVNGAREPDRGQFVLPRYSVSLGPYKVPSGTVYVLGDNRPISEDSRYIGPVPESGIKGRAIFVVAPLQRIKRI
jgi:signal peptidase I